MSNFPTRLAILRLGDRLLHLRAIISCRSSALAWMSLGFRTVHSPEAIPPLNLLDKLAQISDHLDPILPQSFYLLRLPLSTLGPIPRSSNKTGFETCSGGTAIIPVLSRGVYILVDQCYTSVARRFRILGSRFKLIADHDHPFP